ncbi:hypothetical protein [Desulfonatronovibrio hydrogenovorans]|uniref:hypothetical protein n=1 Tax=Desulfonatronovibrio hydrogenovorans TaxID=53245 RepID=UPI00048FE03C|nr:hypothetical protein [Desulfonatronovibrio hydrogenovorans]
MKLTNEQYMALAEMYLMAGQGGKINGLIHNLNNFIHVVDMQLSMLVAKSGSSPKEPLGKFQDKLSRSAGGTAKMVAALHKNGQCAFYSQKSPVQINVAEYIGWLIEFWENDLYFKHKITCEQDTGADDINILVPAFHLTLCLEQGIRNAVEAYQEMDGSRESRIVIRAALQGEGIDLSVSSRTRMPDLDPWLEGSSSKPEHLGMGLPVSAYAAGLLGWKLDLQTGNEEVTFKVSIPKLKPA